MRAFSPLVLASGLLSSLFANAFPHDIHDAASGSPLLTREEDLVARAPTCNTPSNRACWSTGFNINTDYEASTPTTGVTRTYNLVVTEVDNWAGPDGVVKKKVMLINGKILGPTIRADWGDKISITVTNNLVTNGTSMHWHGIRQFNTNLQDGANGVTECPIPPKGGKKTYNFRATQYGSSWYHSHFSAQYGNGVVGTIHIDGPASLPYDIDLGVFPVQDYYYDTADNIVAFTANNAPPPKSDNVLFNGTNINPQNPSQGKYANVTMTPGKRHRLRIINTSTDNHFVMKLAQHQMTIIETDFVPVNANTVDQLFVAIGQRYDVTIDASQAVGNYWFNVTFVPSGLCGASFNPAPAAIFHYAGASGGLPTSPGTAITPPATCTDLLNLVPIVQRSVTVNNLTIVPNNTLDVSLDVNPAAQQLFTWKVNASNIDISWNKPTAQYVVEGNTSYPSHYNIYRIEGKDIWSFWLIENLSPLPHPMHLHGHDFLVVGRSDTGTANPPRFSLSRDIGLLRTNNPIRRDVVMLPANGWLVLAFKTDNPGAWLFHCHIAWHISGGLGNQFLERRDDYRAQLASQTAELASFTNNCNAWRAYYPAMDPFQKQDSGLKLFKGREALE